MVLIPLMLYACIINIVGGKSTCLHHSVNKNIGRESLDSSHHIAVYLGEYYPWIYYASDLWRVAPRALLRLFFVKKPKLSYYFHKKTYRKGLT